MPPTEALVCIRCGVSCCSTCSYTLDAVVYCTRCAESIMSPADAREASPVPAGSIWPQSSAGPSSGPAKSGDKIRWIILVARDQPELFEHLTRAFANDDKVEVILDRRRNFRRNPPAMEERLRVHGAAIVRRQEREP